MVMAESRANAEVDHLDSVLGAVITPRTLAP
jgi:hypothetical protein